MKKKTSGVNIYLGRDEDKARRLAALQALAEKLGVKSVHTGGNSYSPLICMIADLDTERLAQAVRLAQKA